MTLKKAIYTLAAVMIMVVITTAVVFTEPLESTSEDNIKAAYLFNFAKFVEWPKEAFRSDNEPIYVCVLGDDSLASILSSIENKTVGGRKLDIISDQTDVGSRNCHILYIGDSFGRKGPYLLDSIRQKPVLTVSSQEGFASEGGMIGFIRKGNYIRFEVNLDAVRESGLSISSRLLKLAVIVEGGRGGEKGERR